MPPARGREPDAHGREPDLQLTKQVRLLLPGKLGDMLPTAESTTEFLTLQVGVPAERESAALSFTERFYSELCRMPVIGAAAGLAAIPGTTLIFPEEMRFPVDMRGEP